MRLLLASLCPLVALSLPACAGLGRTVTVPLAPIGERGVSGAATLEQTICKSACVQINFSLPDDGEGLRGEIRAGSCDAPGEALGGLLATSASYHETVSMVSSLDELSGTHCVLVHDRATVEAGVYDAPVACGAIP